ncbi:MAG: CBS domain-containing protein [Magnetococcales bacterium]|nr:CBS domain-containing protein [Magnetococcales bacterium]
MNIVRDCMFPNIATLNPGASLMEVLRALVRQRPGFAVVLDKMSPMGLVTEFDLLRWVIKGFDLDRTHLSDLTLSAPLAVHEDTPCQELLRLYNLRRIRRFPVLNEDEILSGGIMEKQILSSLPRTTLLAHYRVIDLLTEEAPLVTPPITFDEVAARIVHWHRGCVLVGDTDRCLGVVTEGDALRCRLRPDWHPDMPVESFMTLAPLTINAQQNLLDALDLFLRAGHRRLPVVDDEGRLVGLLTQTDLLRQMGHSVRTHQAVLNPEDITEPALWFEPGGDHRLLALNRKAARLLELEEAEWVGRSIRPLAVDGGVWSAIATLLDSCGTLNQVTLPLRTGQGHGVCVSCRFSLVHTPTGEDRIFWTLGQMEKGGETCS